MQPFLSIVTVCFNEAAEIRKTCDSIVNQTFQDYEWIVIDGGSTDDTIDILNTYRAKMAYYVSEVDSGIYNAMNKGVQQATGQYVLFLNGGDYLYEATTLEQALQPLKHQNHLPDIIYGEMLNAETGDYLSRLNTKQINLAYFARIANLHHQATFIKTSLFKTIGLHDETYKIAGDYDWWVRYFAQNPKPDLLYQDQKIAYFNMSGISTDPIQREKTLQEVYRAFTQHTGDKAHLIYPYIIREFIKAHIRQLLRFVGLEDMIFKLYKRHRAA